MNLGRALELQSKQYNKKHWPKHFYVGQGVWLYNPKRKVGRTPKLDSGFEPNPYAVVRVIGGVLCEIQQSPRSKAKIVHCDKLEPVRGPYDGRWVLDLPNRTEATFLDENLEGVSKLFVETPSTRTTELPKVTDSEIPVDTKLPDPLLPTDQQQQDVPDIQVTDTSDNKPVMSSEPYDGRITRSRSKLLSQ